MSGGARGGAPLLDAHVHLDLMPNGPEVARAGKALGVSHLATTVTPGGYLGARGSLGDLPGVSLAVGAHPWWVADGRVGARELDLACELVAEERLVGEVGVDLSPRHVDLASRDAQLAAFSRIADAAAAASRRTSVPRVLSIHSVRAADVVLDVLDRSGCAPAGPARGRGRRDSGACRCVFHWFTGSCEELWRAVRAGCRFSVNERMLATGRGRECCRIIPGDRLLLETDLPESYEEPTPASAVAESLDRALARLAAVRDEGEDELREMLRENGSDLLA